MKVFQFFFLFLAITPIQSLFAYDLEGKVQIQPPYPQAIELKVEEKHAADCGPVKLSPKLRVSPEGLVANVVIKLEGNFPSAKFSPSTQNYLLNQIHCEFSPHVLLIPEKSTLSILNSEAVLHNVRAFDEQTKMLFNDAMPVKGQILRKRFEKPGRVIIRCGIHPWMHAITIVQEHPYYALTNESGYFQMKDIPDGNYNLSIWHEVLGEIKTQIGPQSRFLTLTYPPFSNGAS